MCLDRLYRNIKYFIKSLIFGIEKENLIKFDNYLDDLKIYYTIKKSDFLLKDILLDYVIGNSKEIIIDDYYYIIIEKYFKNCKSEILKDILKNNKKIITIKLDIKEKHIIDFIIIFLLLYDDLKVIMLDINFFNIPNFSYDEVFINKNIYNINKEGKIHHFLKLINFFQIYEFYNLEKLIKFI